MPKQHQNKFGWQSALGAIAISLSTFGIRSSPVQAAPKPIKDSFKLAQVGVRSRINPPTPLNLRPRTHIPLPTHSRSQDYYGYPGYRDSYRGSHGGIRTAMIDTDLVTTIITTIIITITEATVGIEDL